MNAADFASESKAAALSRIADILSHPDDLFMKFPSLKTKTVLERASIEAQLKSVLETQLEDAQRGLDALAYCKNETGFVKGNLVSIQDLLNEAHNSIDNYAKIMQISKTHQNFSSTKEMVKQFQALAVQIARIKHFLDEDASRMIGRHANLLMIHFQLYEFQRFKAMTLNCAKDTTSDVRTTLESFFFKIDQLMFEFEDYLWELARLTLPLIKAGHASVVVRVVKIIETEERSDEQVAAYEMHAQSSEGPKKDERLWKTRAIKGYRIKYFDVLREAIVKNFDVLYEQLREDLTQFLAGVDVVMDDLVVVYDELVPRFPRRYNIFQFFVLEYHRIIYDVLNRIVREEMENAAILQLLKWVHEYYANIHGRLGVGEELLEPRLLDGKEGVLVRQYVRNVQLKLKDWLGKLLVSESYDFVRRESAPEEDNEHCFQMAGPVILFQMFNQQIDACHGSSRGSLLSDVVAQCMDCMDEYQRRVTELVNSEMHRFEANLSGKEHGKENSKENAFAQGLPEYCMAVANDGYRSTEFTEALAARLESLMDEPYREQATVRLREASSQFIKLSKRACGALCDMALADCRPAVTPLFQSTWYEQELIRLVVGTLDDYCHDFEAHLAQHLFTKLTNDLIDRLVLCYLEAMRHKHAKFKIPFAIERIRSDLKCLTDFFLKFKPEKRVKLALDIIDKVASFLECNPRLAYMDFYNMYKMYPDMPFAFVEDLVLKRDDLEKAQAKEILESIKEKMAEQGEVSDKNQTIFSRLYPKK